MTTRRKNNHGKSASGATSTRRSNAAKQRTTFSGTRAQIGRQHTRAERTAAQHREVQRKGERLREQREEAQKKTEVSKESPVQAGPEEQPAPPLPAQHLEKPGIESRLVPRPSYEAPAYVGSGKLLDMVALVTGGDSGIGRAVAVLFAREGADVMVAYLSEHEDAEETKRAVENEGRRCLTISGDVTDPHFCEQAVDATIHSFGQIDILVNNAAFQMGQKSIEDITPEQFDTTIRTNIHGYFFMTKAALPHLGRGSSIINTGSVVGFRGHKGLVDYAMTKGAVHNFTKSLAQNLAEKGIRVNGVAPGPVWTPLNPADKSAEEIRNFGDSVLMKRPAQPEEISPAYVFLAAPSCASYITGEMIGVIGGEE